MVELKVINAKIKKLAAAEKVTKQVLAELSRDLLAYVLVQESHDVGAVNRLLAVLTPVNFKTAVLFFSAFLPHEVDEHGTFGGLVKKEKAAKLQTAVDFLENEDNNIWTWADANVKVEKKEIDFLGKVTKAISQAIEKGQVNQLDLVKAVLAGGLELSALTALMKDAVAVDKEAADAMGKSDVVVRQTHGISIDQPELLAEVC